MSSSWKRGARGMEKLVPRFQVGFGDFFGTKTCGGEAGVEDEVYNGVERLT